MITKKKIKASVSGETLFRLPEGSLRIDDNPMVMKHGYGEKGKTCKDCAFLMRREVYGYWRNKNFYKCKKYPHQGRSERSDFRLKWNACKLFQEEKK